MLKKLKSKFKEIIGNRKVLSMPFLGIFLLFVGFGIFYPNPASLRAALCQNINGSGFSTKPNGHQVPNSFGYQTCRIDEIKVQTDIYPSNRDTNPDNFAKVGKDGTLTLAMKITLVQPDTLTFDSDELDFQSSDDKEISGFSFGVLEKSQNSSKCSTDSKMTGYVPLLGNSSTYLYCDFGSGLRTDKNRQAMTVTKGEVLYKYHLTLSPSHLATLGITEAGKTYELYLYPMIWYDGAFKDSPVVINGAGKSMYVQLFATDAAAKADTSPKPDTIPGYGGNIGSGFSGTEQSNTIMKIIEWVVGFLLGLIQELIYVLFYYFVAPLIQGMLSIRTYTDTFVAVIYPGWEIIRNVCNIIFIVALIAIAMGTLLRVDAYKSKQVLVQLILAALLVNFSLVIGQAILGVADTVQNQFLPNNTEVVRALGKDLMVSYRSIIYDTSGMQLSGNFAGIVRHVIFVTLSAGSFMVFLALAAYLFIRVVMLWVLLMISPLAYAAGALPSTAHYRQEWWQQFIKYAFFTPIMAFFINLTAIIATQQKNNPILKAVGVNTAEFGDSSFAKMVFQVGGNLIMLVFLVVGMKLAEQFSIMGAGKITGFAQKGMYAPLGLMAKPVVTAAKALPGFAGRTYSKWAAEKAYQAKLEGKKGKQFFWNAAQMLNPTVLKKGWEAYSHEKEMESYDPGAGDLRDFFNRYVPTNYEWKKKGILPTIHNLGNETDYGKINRVNVTAHRRSELEKAPLSEEQKVDFGLKLHHPGELIAQEYIYMDGRHEDGRMITYHALKRDKIAQEILERLKKENADRGGTKSEMELENEAKKQADKQTLVWYDPVEYVDLITESLKHGGMTDEQIATELVYLTEYSEAQNKERAHGYSLREWDGRDRAINDFSGYADYEKKYGSKELMKKIFGDTNGQGVEVFEVDGEGNLVFQPRLFDGTELGEARTIKTFEDFQKAIDGTHKENWLDVQKDTKLSKEQKLDRHFKGLADLRYIIMGARKALDAGKRLKRGNSEDKFAMMEPAVENAQYEDGFYGTNTYSMFKAHYVPRNIATKIPNMRRFQGRNMYIMGLKENTEGRVILEDITMPDGSVTEKTVDYETMAVKLVSNPPIFSAVLQSMGFNDEELKIITKHLNESNVIQQARARDNKVDEFALTADGPGGRNWVQVRYQGEPPLPPPSEKSEKRPPAK